MTPNVSGEDIVVGDRRAENRVDLRLVPKDRSVVAAEPERSRTRRPDRIGLRRRSMWRLTADEAAPTAAESRPCSNPPRRPRTPAPGGRRGWRSTGFAEFVGKEAGACAFAAFIAVPKSEPERRGASSRNGGVSRPPARSGESAACGMTSLHHRVAMTRCSDRETATHQSRVVQQAMIQPLFRYWGAHYDRRRAGPQLNALSQFKAEMGIAVAVHEDVRSSPNTKSHGV